MQNTILSLLPKEHPWRETLHVYETAGSTNTLAKEMASANAPHGTVIIARQQTGGRGRLGRSFSSQEGGLYFSLILRPNRPARELMHLTCAAAVAGCRAIEQVCCIQPGIKWTNDLVFGSKKLGGILTELSFATNSEIVEAAIIGIGINCAQKQEDFPEEIRDIALSLTQCSDTTVTPEKMAAALMEALYEMDRALYQTEPMMQAYRGRCITIGKEISLIQGDAISHGTALDVDAQGALVVRFRDGTVKTVSSGEVSVRGMYGYV
jgi:BirA family biotin operon repressor/biotin-[acetyl-CoA-carboxylase] ligase